MGGGPTIQGGMTQQEYQEILAEDRRFAQEQDTIRRAQALEDAARQREEQKIERDRVKQEELTAIQDLAEAEASIFSELEATDEESQKNLTIDFFGSLAEGVSSSGSVNPTGKALA